MVGMEEPKHHNQGLICAPARLAEIASRAEREMSDSFTRG
jgi:hypothetical protein